MGDSGFRYEVEKMVGMALDRLSKPYGEDVIEDVFVEIERSPYRKREYEQLCASRGPATVNQWVGRVTRELTGYDDGKAANRTTRTTLAQSYTKLVRRR